MYEDVIWSNWVEDKITKTKKSIFDDGYSGYILSMIFLGIGVGLYAIADVLTLLR